MHTQELARLAHLAQEAAIGQPDLIALLVEVVKDVAASDADPYLAIGAMIEGIAHTLSVRIPDERQKDTAGATVGLLLDQLRGRGLV